MLSSSRENPRPIQFAKPMSNELATAAATKQPASATILDRFRAALKQQHGDGDDVVPSMEEIVRLYEVVLSELTFNSKPIITDLTIIAGDHREHAEGIADAICSRILEIPVEQKLPSLYLLDSIVKNIGQEYVRHFAKRLPEVFCEAYRQVHPNMYSAMRHLFGTWSTVFPQTVLRKIETQLQFSPAVSQSSGMNSLRSSESPRPSHGIHVNPKYIRQLENSSADSVGAQRLNPSGSVSRASFVREANKLNPSSTSRPSRVGADGPLSLDGDEFVTDNYGLRRASGRDDETSEWRRSNYRDAYNLSNGHELQRPRALIDAYGNDRGNKITNGKALQVDHLDINGMGKKVAPRSWQNTEEEEFDWEDMSPALLDRNRSNDFLLSSVPPVGSTGARPSLGKSSVGQLEAGFRSNFSGQMQLPLLDESSTIAENTVMPLGSGRGRTAKFSGFRSESNQVVGSHYPLDARNLPHHASQTTHLLNPRGRGRDFRFPDADAHFVRAPPVVSRIGSSSVDSLTVKSRPAMVPASTAVWPPINVHKSHPPLGHSIHPPQKQSRSQFDSVNAGSNIMNQGPNRSPFLPELQFDSFDSKEPSSLKPPQCLSQQNNLNLQNEAQVTALQSQFIPSQEVQENRFPSVAPPMPPHLLAPPLNQGYAPHQLGAVIGMAASNPLPHVQVPLPIPTIPTSLHLTGRTLPPLPPGPPPSSSQPTTGTTNSGPLVANQPQGAFSGLISSLMAQGLISLTKQVPMQDPLGLEFNADILKVRHESAIRALYADLPRQCTTCGLRFKCQEEHSSHMDWHVTKNRMSKSRKQKPSRKWFVSASMWLSGVEALGTDAVPGFLPIETIEEKEDGEELAVPADEDQNVCALCGEPFDDFYSDETEEWMYRGAVYMNAPDGKTAGMDRSQLGPIVHAKCRSESSVVPPEDFGRDEGGSTEEGSQRKRLRS